MSVTKNPAIASLDPGSLCHGIYSELYSQFFNAQDRKDAQHPYGVVEGDDVSIRLHNAAYGFAYAIAGAVDGGGSGEGGILLDYLRKDGSDMVGMLRANYGFEAGQENKVLLSTYDSGIRFNEDIDVWGGICLSGKRVLGYDPGTGTLRVSAEIIDLGAGSLKSTGNIVVGDVKITTSGVKVGDHDVYHKGNANLPTVNWTMKDATVVGSLNVADGVTLSGNLKALNGVNLGMGGRSMMLFREDNVFLNGHLSLGDGCGIRVGGITVLGRTGISDIAIGVAGGDLLLGSGNTNRVRLLSAITDADGDYQLLSPYGAAHFPDSLTVRHNYGEVLLSTYRTDSTDEGVVIHKRLRFGDSHGSFLQAQNNGIALNSFFEYIKDGVTHKVGATAIGTGINSDPDYPAVCEKHLKKVTGLPMVIAANMIEATNDTSAFVTNSSAQKRLAIKLSKICNDLRLMGSGPRCGLGEINLPPRQPGSSIMPGKVNPVIPEVVNQVAFRVIGNDLTVTMGAEAAQLELNVMEPVIVNCLFESIEMMENAMNTLREKCVVGITANPEVCRATVYNSIGLVTALNPYIGYEASTRLAKEALETGAGIYDLVLKHKMMSKEELDNILRPENMVKPRKLPKK